MREQWIPPANNKKTTIVLVGAACFSLAPVFVYHLADLSTCGIVMHPITFVAYELKLR